MIQRQIKLNKKFKRYYSSLISFWNVPILILLIAYCLLFPSVVTADDVTTSIVISPAIIDKKLDPGQSVKQEIKIFNKEDKAVALNVYAMNFQASDMFGGMSFDEDETRQFSAKSWISLPKQNLVLAPYEKSDFVLDIDIPKDAEPGGHYAVIFFEFRNQTDFSDDSSLGINQRMGALVFLTVNSEIKEEGMVLGASTNSKCSGVQCSFKTATTREWGPVPFEFKFENTGNVHVKLKGKIVIHNIFGRQVAEIPVDEKTVLPKSTRQFEAKWLREPLFGKYTAKLSVEYGSSKTTQYAETSFWAVPWKLLLFPLILFFITVFFVIRFTKKNKKAEPPSLFCHPRENGDPENSVLQ